MRCLSREGTCHMIAHPNDSFSLPGWSTPRQGWNVVKFSLDDLQFIKSPWTCGRPRGSIPRLPWVRDEPLSECVQFVVITRVSSMRQGELPAVLVQARPA